MSTQQIRMPVERKAITHRFQIAETKGYLTVGLREDGNPGEIFLTISKAGTKVRGFAMCTAILISVLLQHQVPLKKVIEKLRDMRFEPSGFTKNPAIPFAKSIPDYVARWLELKFMKKETNV